MNIHEGKNQVRCVELATRPGTLAQLGQFVLSFFPKLPSRVFSVQAYKLHLNSKDLQF